MGLSFWFSAFQSHRNAPGAVNHRPPKVRKTSKALKGVLRAFLVGGLRIGLLAKKEQLRLKSSRSSQVEGGISARKSRTFSGLSVHCGRGITVVLLTLASLAQAAEPPYFVTYSSALEEPGNLEIGEKNVVASPEEHYSFTSATLELEYGATAYWTTEVYLAGQARSRDSAIFTGFRWENRFRPLPRDHFINPVLYIEYEDINGADRSLLEIVGHDTFADLRGSNAKGRAEVKHEVEGKLILSSDFKGWNVSENFIAEKNLTNSPWEFGYALGVSRPLMLAAVARNCVFCRQNVTVGAELYGGLGDRYSFGLHDTSHYAGPTFDFNIPRGPTIGFAPQFGVNGNSVTTLWRFKVSYEVQQFRDLFRRKDAH